MKVGDKVIVPHVSVDPEAGLTLRLETVKDAKQTDGWSNPADYDYDLILESGKRIHWSWVFGVPDDIEVTQELLDDIAAKWKPGREARVYVFEAFAEIRANRPEGEATLTLTPDQKTDLVILLNVRLRDDLSEVYHDRIHDVFRQLTGRDHESHDRPIYKAGRKDQA